MPRPLAPGLRATILALFTVLAAGAPGQTWDVEWPIATPGLRSYEVEAFTADGVHHVALATGWDENASNSAALSTIYRFADGAFTAWQDIPTLGCHDIEAFTIGDDLYLAVANSFDSIGGTGNIDSRIFRRQGPVFVQHQAIPTRRAYDFEPFEIDGTAYLAVANNSDGSYIIESKIYRWNGSQFVEHQGILTRGAYEWESFTIDGTPYLVVANWYDTDYDVTSAVYRWNGSTFVFHQSLPTVGARGWEFFVLQGVPHLVVANSYDGASYAVDSVVYRWSGTQFEQDQTLATVGAADFEYFELDGQSYLAMASWYDGGDLLTTSAIYRYGSSWLPDETIATTSALDWEFVELAGQPVLLLAQGWDGQQSLAYGLTRPTITGISDVPNDQGRAVRLQFDRSSRDVPGSAVPILQYEAYRRIDPLPGAARAQAPSATLAAPGERLAAALAAGMLPGGAPLLDAGWDYVGAAPAHVQADYSLIVPTLADSTIADGMHWSTFFVRAATGTPAVFHDSRPDSGYSTDDLAPAVPADLAVVYGLAGNALSWGPPADGDFQHFRIYRGAAPDFEPSPDNLAHATTAQQWLDETADPYGSYYLVTAVDFAGNESDAAAPGTVTPAPDALAARAVVLRQNHPNPFNPQTVIRYEIRGPATRVQLDVHDVRGQRVRRLVDGVRAAGAHAATWDGRDDAGRPVASGTYHYRLRAGGVTEARRMVLLK